jgi:thiamine-monophosphate kinase
MNLKELGEFGLIERLQRGCLVRPDGVVRAIGDDAAVFQTDGDQVTLLTTDLLIERVHFLRQAISGEDLGHKALAVNLSDIAAMGAEPREAFVSIAVPPDCSVAFLEEIYNGMRTLAGRHQVNILGGDTTTSRRDLVINVAVTGRADPQQVLFRDGAGVGDVICVTGPLGESRAGLQLILAGRSPDDEHLRRLYRQHVRPEPHLAQGRLLAASGVVTAAIDLSDGLLSDLAHVARQSGVGAIVHADQVPISPALAHFCRQNGTLAIDLALGGGEDYVLLVTVKPDALKRLSASFAAVIKSPLYAIGEMVAGEGVRVLSASGDDLEISATSWDHFKEH